MYDEMVEEEEEEEDNWSTPQVIYNYNILIPSI